jgi:tRNA(Ile2) C34 agmatinyltransferase TiaS
MFKYAFEPLEICCICGKYTYYSSDIEGKWYCKECVTHMPEDKKHKWQKDIEKRHEVSA